MSISKKILIIAGEESGDMYGANIIQKLSKNQNITFYAMGSSKMQMTSAKIVVDSSKLSVVGFFEILRIYPKLLNALIKIKKSVDEIKPDLLILIDYQEFNFKIAKYAKSKGIKVLFYISPQVWAWRENRIKKIKNYIDTMAVIFPFEKSYYKKYDVKVEYVGHPLIENIDTDKTDINNLVSKNKKIISIMPGSRKSETSVLLPILIDFINMMNSKDPNYSFVFHATDENKDHIIDYIKNKNLKNIHIAADCSFDLPWHCNCDLEACLRQFPKASTTNPRQTNIFILLKHINVSNIFLNELSFLSHTLSPFKNSMM